MKPLGISDGGGNLGEQALFTVEDVLNWEPAIAGYHHKLAGDGFHPLYETCSPQEQEAYELGRAMAVIFGPGAYYSTIHKALAVTAQALSRMAAACQAGDAHPTLEPQQRAARQSPPAPAARRSWSR